MIISLEQPINKKTLLSYQSRYSQLNEKGERGLLVRWKQNV
jgi:hypothetical protein